MRPASWNEFDTPALKSHSETHIKMPFKFSKIINFFQQWEKISFLRYTIESAKVHGKSLKGFVSEENCRSKCKLVFGLFFPHKKMNSEKCKRPDDDQPPHKRKKTKGTGSYCCVVWCRSNSLRDAGWFSFHKFPKQNKEQAEAWARAIMRVDARGNPWTPIPYSVICSRHFFNGKVSHEKNHPGYIPSIFPTDHVPPKTDVDERRFVRARRSLESKEATYVRNKKTLVALKMFFSFTLSLPLSLCSKEKKKGSVSFLPFVYRFKTKTSSEVECEANLRVPLHVQPVSSVIRNFDDGVGIQVTMAPKKTSRDASSEANIVLVKSSIATQISSENFSRALQIQLFSGQMFKAFCGVPHNLFNFFLFQCYYPPCIPPTKWAPSQKVLLFLVKIKLNVSFLVLGGILEISRQSASNFFQEVCDGFYLLAKKHIVFFWSSNYKIKNAPFIRALYPNCTFAFTLR